MADDDKQVEIEVALRDTASQTLRGISREIDNITRKLVETGRRGNEALDGLKRKGGEAGKGTENAAHGVDQFTKSISGLAKTLSGPLGLAGVLYGISKSLTSFTLRKAELSMLATDLDLTTKKMGEVKQILMRKGLSEESAKKFITGIGEQLQELRVSGSASAFYQRLAVYGDNALTEGLMKAMRSGKTAEAFDMLINHVQDMMKVGEEGSKRREEGMNRARYAARNLLGQRLSDFTDWDEMRKDLIKSFDSDDEAIKKALIDRADLIAKATDAQNRLFDSLIEGIMNADKAYKNSSVPKPPGTPGSPTPGSTPSLPNIQNKAGDSDSGLQIYGPRNPNPTAPSITVPGNLGPRSDLGTSGATDFSSSNRRRGGISRTLDEVEPIEKETNQTLISIRDILQAMYGDPTVSPGGGGGTTPGGGGGATPGGGGGPPGGGGGGGTTGTHPGAMGGTVHGHQVEPYGNWTGKDLIDPVTASSLGGGVGGHSGKFGAGHHMGLDIMGAANSPVVAPAGGTVTRVGQDGFGNQTIVIDHGGGNISRILHIKGVPFKAGDKVEPGQHIGNIGFARAWHIHYEMFRGSVDKQGNPHGTLSNPRAVFKYGPGNLPVRGTPRTGAGPGGAPATPSTPAATSSAAPSGGQKTAFQILRDAAAAAGIKDPDTAASIAMLESGGMKRGNRSVFDKSGGTNPFGQTVRAGTPGAVLGRDGQWHATYSSLQEAFEFHKQRWGDAYGDSPEETLAEMRRRGYNKENRNWQKDIEAIRRRETLDRGSNRQSSRNGSVKATVDFGALQRTREAGEIFMPVRTASFSQGSTVHRTAALPGSADYSRWTA